MNPCSLAGPACAYAPHLCITVGALKWPLGEFFLLLMESLLDTMWDLHLEKQIGEKWEQAGCSAMVQGKEMMLWITCPPRVCQGSESVSHSPDIGHLGE